MNNHWKKKSQEEIKATVFKALESNVDYDKQNVFGIPASYLDDKVFNHLYFHIVIKKSNDCVVPRRLQQRQKINAVAF